MSEKRNHSPDKTKKSGKKSKRSDWVTMEFDNETTEYFANWSGSGAPIKELTHQISLEFKDKKEKELNAVDKASRVEFSGTADEMDTHSNYFVGIREGDRMVIRPAKFYNIRPAIQFEKDAQLEQEANKPRPDLSRELLKEQRTNLTDTFGSKQSRKLLVDKEKYTVALDDNDLEELKASEDLANASKSGASWSTGNSSHMSMESVNGSTIHILPEQNLAAISPGDVYDVHDIVKVDDINLIKSSVSLEDLDWEETLGQKFLLPLKKKKKDDDKVLLLYLDALVAIQKSNAHSFAKKSPLDDEIKTDVIRTIVLDRYSSIRNTPRGPRHGISDEQKDRAFIHALILYLKLTKFNPIRFTDITSNFGCSAAKLRKLAVLVGCYIEKQKENGLNIEKVVFKLPLNKLQTAKNRRSR